MLRLEQLDISSPEDNISVTYEADTDSYTFRRGPQ